MLIFPQKTLVSQKTRTVLFLTLTIGASTKQMCLTQQAGEFTPTQNASNPPSTLCGALAS